MDHAIRNSNFRIWALLHEVSHLINRARDKEVRNKTGYSVGQVGLIGIIKLAGEPLTPAQLSRLALREPNTMHKLLKALYRQGLAEAVRDEHNKHMQRVLLTKKGEMAYRKSITFKVIHKILAPISQEDRLVLENCLRQTRKRALKQLGLTHEKGLADVRRKMIREFERESDKNNSPDPAETRMRSARCHH